MKDEDDPPPLLDEWAEFLITTQKVLFYSFL